MKATARWVSAAAVLGLALALGGPLRAQTVYKIVGPDGRVTFSDTPPTDPGPQKAAPAKVLPFTPGATGGGTGNAALPFELRQAAARYPVTLYTAPGCAPCLSGRALLAGRGIPFSERTVTSNDDIEALRRLAGAATLPLLTVGAQQVKGFAEPEWVQFLDAAGYPRSSQLPPGWLPPPARPLVEAQAQPAPAAPEPPQAPASPVPGVAPGQDESNPAGIRF